MTKVIGIVIDNKLVETVNCIGMNESEIHTRCFEYADQKYGNEVVTELYDFESPRHKVLFDNIQGIEVLK